MSIVQKPTNIQKKEPTEPWRPAALLDLPPVPGRRIRWVHKDKLARKLQEGWKVIEAKSDPSESRIIDGTQKGSYIMKGNLIACEMPEEVAKSRDAYFQRMTDASLSAATKSFKGKFGASETYGEGASDDEEM